MEQDQDRLRVTLVGVGDATDLLVANNAQLLRGPVCLLVDCGQSVPMALARLLEDPNELDAIWLTHCHADHVMGLPALLMWLKRQGRTRPILIGTGLDAAGAEGRLGPPGSEARSGKVEECHWIHTLLELGYAGSFRPERCFPIDVIELASEDSLRINAGGSWSLQPTQGVSESSDNALRLRCAKSSHRVVNWALRVDYGASSVAFSGDGAPTPATIALYQGVALLIHECLADHEVPAGHASLDDLERIALACAPSRIIAVHVQAQARVQLESVLSRRTGTYRTMIGLGYASDVLEVP